jgi:hypothetical protein
MLSEHKRIKHGQHPGDYIKKRKIAMREKRVPFRIYWGGDAFTTISVKCAKAFRNFFKFKSKKRQRQRDKDEIKLQLDEKP